MQNIVDPHQYDAWNNLALNLALGFWAVGILIILGYIIKLSTTGGNKEKYDFINRYEIRTLWIATIVLALKRFGKNPQPGPHSRVHSLLGWASTIDITLTSVTGLLFYYMAFVR